MKVLCGWLIKGDPHRPCYLAKGHAFAHRDEAYVKAGSQRARARYRADPAYFAAWRDENRESLRAYGRRYAREHADELGVYNKQWREANRDRKRTYKQLWNAANLDKRREYKRARRAREMGATHIPYSREEVYALTDGRCYLCKSALVGVWHVDHVQPLSRGGSDTILNVMPSCESCNLSKGAKTLEEFLGVG